MQTYKVSFSIKLANSADNGGTDPPPAEHPKPITGLHPKGSKQLTNE
jgi:hypothetical protein